MSNGDCLLRKSSYYACLFAKSNIGVGAEEDQQQLHSVTKLANVAAVVNIAITTAIITIIIVATAAAVVRPDFTVVFVAVTSHAAAKTEVRNGSLNLRYAVFVLSKLRAKKCQSLCEIKLLTTFYYILLLSKQWINYRDIFS